MEQQNKISLNFLGEPHLEFRYKQKVIDPKLGLSIFGPFDTDLPSHPKNISYGIVGTKIGIELSRLFFEKVQKPILSQNSTDNPRLWPMFPGFEAAFYSTLPPKCTRFVEIETEKLIEASLNYDPNRRAFETVNSYLDGIKQLVKPDDPLDVIICVVPDIIYENCRPKSTVKEGVGEKVSLKIRKKRAEGQTDLFQTYTIDMYQYSVHFRRQLKARALESHIEPPTQILLESTLKENDPASDELVEKSPLSDRAWNICTTLYYKAGGKPWRLSTARDGVCYVGIVYHKTDQKEENQSACCAAQMFLDNGDGVVIRGDTGPWYSTYKKQFHLTKEAAEELLKRVLNTYSELGGKPLTEVFLHYRASIDSSEYEGFKAACPSEVKINCIKIRQEKKEVRLYREGTRPVLRGTFLQVKPRRGYLWASGFKPFLGTYDGWETPVPLRIDVEFGDADIKQVAIDILGLTKLNFNECKYADSQPVTIGFSDAVGEILVSNHKIKDPNPKFKYYI
jgi:hypothetical protein